ncbi:sensor histidine kinase [Catalinimonas alkaloidigena]|nr:ATP-binding protein [Catalinimonas alkaloidigena]
MSLLLDRQGTLLAATSPDVFQTGASGLMVGHPFAALFEEQDRQQGTPARLLSETLVQGEATYTARRQDAAPLQLTVSPLFDDQRAHQGYLCTLQSPTPEGPSSDHLLREIEQVEKQLESLRYAVSHDLKAPLRAIMSYSQILEEEFQEQLDEEGVRVLKILMKNAHRLGQRLDVILEMSRLDRKALTCETLDMTQLFTNVLDELRQKEPEQRQIDAQIDTLPPAFGDRELMKGVATQLLSNALKFSSPRETTAVHIGGEATGAEVRYFVQDNGVGYDDRYADQLFQPFKRLHKERDFEGMGIGLTVAASILAKHGGRIWGESTLEEGATFFFTLPTQTSPS